MINQEIVVIAKSVSPKSITYVCPSCRTKYKKDGNPTLRSKPVIHIHGNETQSSDNRTTHRSHHKCWNFPHHLDAYQSVNIVIDDTTERLGF